MKNFHCVGTKQHGDMK